MSNNISKAQFEEWAKEQHWLMINEGSNPSGRQYQYVTPTGNVDIAVFDLAGTLLAVIPMPVQAVQPVQPEAFRFPPGQTPFGTKQ